MSYDYPSLRAHFVEGTRRGDSRWRDDLTHAELVDLWLVKQDDERCAAIDTTVQELKNASLGKTPEQIADVLRLQVNMGIGGLLLMLRRLELATGEVLVSKGVCTTPEFLAALENALGPEANAVITKRLLYWDWIVNMDTHAADLKANPSLPPNFPPPPQLN